jgi:hypothetical protein
MMVTPGVVAWRSMLLLVKGRQEAFVSLMRERREAEPEYWGNT